MKFLSGCKWGCTVDSFHAHLGKSNNWSKWSDIVSFYKKNIFIPPPQNEFARLTPLPSAFSEIGFESLPAVPSGISKIFPHSLEILLALKDPPWPKGHCGCLFLFWISLLSKCVIWLAECTQAVQKGHLLVLYSSASND